MQITIKRQGNLSYSKLLSTLPYYTEHKFSDLQVTPNTRTLVNQDVTVMITINIADMFVVVSDFTTNTVYSVTYDNTRQRNNIYRRLHPHLFGV